MKTFSKFLLTGMTAIALVVSSVGSAFCQAPPEPSIVVSIANVQEQLGDAKYILEAAGMGQLEFFLKVQADSYLKGVNNDQPAGAMFFFEEDEMEPKWLAFLPIDNLDDVLNTISQNIGEVEEGDEYTTIINDDGEEIFVKSAEGFAYMADDSSMFGNIPANPTTDLGDLPTRYNVSAKIFGQRIPESLRDQAVDLIREGYERQLNQIASDDEDELAAEIREKNFEVQMASIRSMVNETESLVLGMAADKDTQSLYFDMEMTALPDSEFAASCALMASADPTRFGGFISNDSAFNMNMCIKIRPEDAEQYSSSMDTLVGQAMKDMREDGDMSEEQIAVAEKAMNDIFGVISETLAGGTIDGGMIVTTQPGDVNFAMGMVSADPGKVETAVKEIVAEAEKELSVDEMTVNLDAGTLRGAKIHELIFTVPDNQEEARDMFGDTVSVVFGIGGKEVYVAGGNNPKDLLARVMEDSETASADEQVPMQWNLYLEPIMRFAASVEGEPMVEDMADKLAEAGNDRVSIVADLRENGMSLRFDVQDGILKLIGVAAENFGGGFAPADDDFQPQPVPTP